MSELRLAIDKMLGRLARRLLILGVDAKLRRDDETLMEFLESALQEGRVVVSTSRQLYRTVKSTKRLRELPLIYAREEHQDRLLDKLRTLGVELPREKVLTRCTVCNLPLREVDISEVASLLPEYVRWRYDKVWLCEGCGRVYWPGSHYKSMYHSVERFISS